MHELALSIEQGEAPALDCSWCRWYDSLQMWGEDCERGYSNLNRSQTYGMPCNAEIVSCHAACLALPLRRPRRTGCIPGLPMRTGLHAQLECRCNDSNSFANCDLTSQLPSVLVDRELGMKTITTLGAANHQCQTTCPVGNGE